MLFLCYPPFKNFKLRILAQGCQSPTFSNIEEGMIDDVIMHGTLRHLWKKNARKRCCWNCNIWPNWFTYHQSHYCLYYNGIPEFVRKRSMLNVAQYLKFHCQKVESTRNGKLRRLSGRFQTVPGSQIVGKTRKWGRGGKKGKTRGERACNHLFYDSLPPPPPLPSFLPFFSFSRFLNSAGPTISEPGTG